VTDFTSGSSSLAMWEWGNLFPWNGNDLLEVACEIMGDPGTRKHAPFGLVCKMSPPSPSPIDYGIADYYLVTEPYQL